MRVVIDTNVVLSGTYWKGDSRKVLQLVEEDKIICIASLEIVKEYKRILEHPDILEKIDELQVTQRASTIKLVQKMVIIEPKIKIKLSKDLNDNKFIEAAVEGRAQYIISNDHDLIDIIEYSRIKLLTAKEFIEIIKNKLN